MPDFSLAAEFIDPEGERTLLAAIAGNPPLYWELLDAIPPDAFAHEAEAWRTLAAAIEAGKPAPVDPAWSPAADPRAAAATLADLAQRRRIAQAQERVAEALFAKPPRPAGEILALLEAEAVRARAAARDDARNPLQWAGDVAPAVLAEAAEARERADRGLPTARGFVAGIPRLDEATGGLRPGLNVLGGGPGVGKTTLATQMAIRGARDGWLALFISYENAPANLVLKILCAATGSVATSDVEKGRADLVALRRAAEDLAPALGRIAFIEGTTRLAIDDIRARARQVAARGKEAPLLIVFDYLQRAAYAQGYEQVRHNVSALSGKLRELGVQLDCPVLAISSQNRAAGGYGSGSGSAALDSLKESGDLEYDADTVLFLRNSDQRRADPPAVAVDLVLSKNRYGESGLVVPLIFRPDVATLREEARGAW